MSFSLLNSRTVFDKSNQRTAATLHGQSLFSVRLRYEERVSTCTVGRIPAKKDNKHSGSTGISQHAQMKCFGWDPHVHQLFCYITFSHTIIFSEWRFHEHKYFVATIPYTAAIELL